MTDQPTAARARASLARAIGAIGRLDSAEIFSARAGDKDLNDALIAGCISFAASETAALREALRPFADCCEYISDDESDEEWAKFRLLIKDYRRARAALEPPAVS